MAVSYSVLARSLWIYRERVSQAALRKADLQRLSRDINSGSPGSDSGSCTTCRTCDDISMFVQSTVIPGCVKCTSKYARMFKNVFGSGFLVRTAHVFLTWVITLILFLHDTGESICMFISFISQGNNNVSANHLIQHHITSKEMWME